MGSERNFSIISSYLCSNGLYVSIQSLEKLLSNDESEAMGDGKLHRVCFYLGKSELARGDSLIIDGMNAGDERKFLIEQMTSNLSIIKRVEAARGTWRGKAHR